MTFGRYTGETPKERDQGLQRFREMWPAEKVIPNELKSREEMWATPPDILMTNFAMLEYSARQAAGQRVLRPWRGGSSALLGVR